MAEYTRPHGRARAGKASPAWGWLSRDDSAYSALHGRVKRLAAVSAVALGVISALSFDEGSAGASGALVAGWLLMPAVLLLSLRLPALKFGLALPSALVSLAALWLSWQTWPASGWPLVAVGVLMGAVMGSWFWFRWAPIPGAFSRHDSVGRWALVAAHVALVLSGMVALLAS